MTNVSKAQCECDHCGRLYTKTSSRQKYCKICAPTKSARMRILRYGVSGPEFEQMLAEQDGLCALCLEWPATELDHDHDTGRVRAILCRVCNFALGRFEDETWRGRATEYALC